MKRRRPRRKKGEVAERERSPCTDQTAGGRAGRRRAGGGRRGRAAGRRMRQLELHVEQFQSDRRRPARHGGTGLDDGRPGRRHGRPGARGRPADRHDARSAWPATSRTRRGSTTIRRPARTPPASTSTCRRPSARRSASRRRSTRRPFDSIILSIKGGKNDMIMSDMYDNAEREGQGVSFVDYAFDGTSILVKKGNPDGITDARRPGRQDGRLRERHDAAGVPPEAEQGLRELRARPR